MHHFFHGGVSASQLDYSVFQSSISDQDCEEDAHLIIPAKERVHPLQHYSFGVQWTTQTGVMLYCVQYTACCTVFLSHFHHLDLLVIVLQVISRFLWNKRGFI